MAGACYDLHYMCRIALGAALLRRRLFRLFIGVFARGRSLFGSFCAGTAPTRTGVHRDGLLSGALFAFNTPLLTRTAHLQAVHIYWLPLAFLAFQRLLTYRRARDAAWLGLCLIGAGLTSGTSWFSWRLRSASPRWCAHRISWGVRASGFCCGLRLRLAAVATVALLTLLVVLRPYVEAGYRRPPVAEAAEMTTALSSYLSSAAIVHYRSWSSGYFHTAPGILFPGVITLVLAGVAVCCRRCTAPRGTRRMLLAASVSSFPSARTHRSTPGHTRRFRHCKGFARFIASGSWWFSLSPRWPASA